MALLHRTGIPCFCASIACALLEAASSAQAPQPLPPVAPAPSGNPVTASKAALGKALFWDEQLSSNHTVACGTCHATEVSGTDPRPAIPTYSGSVHAGPDHLFGTEDDVSGSLGVTLADENGHLVLASMFRLDRQVTPRRSQGAVNSGLIPRQFWDGRAEGALKDPSTGAIVLAQGASLEVQALEPVLNTGEMSHLGRDWDDVAARLQGAVPLRLATDIPPALSGWIQGRSYPALFQEAFGSSDVTAVRIAMAIASYERTLCSNQSPFDDFLAGNSSALTPLEQQGLQVFNGPGRCHMCHVGSLATDNEFYYTGVRPAGEDPGRAGVTGLAVDQGAMKTPSLRNVELRAPYFHNGRTTRLEDVIEFYDRGGDFTAVNKAAPVAPIGLTQQQKDALLAFLTRPLTDPRVAQRLPPFDRPTLSSESNVAPAHYGTATAGSGGFEPELIAFEPALVGSPHWTVGIDRARGGKQAFLLLGPIQWEVGVPFQGAMVHVALSASTQVVRIGNLEGGSPGSGFGSATLAIPDDPQLLGQTFYAQWLVLDPQGVGKRLSATDAVEVTYW